MINFAAKKLVDRYEVNSHRTLRSCMELRGQHSGRDRGTKWFRSSSTRAAQQRRGIFQALYIWGFSQTRGFLWDAAKRNKGETRPGVSSGGPNKLYRIDYIPSLGARVAARWLTPYIPLIHPHPMPMKTRTQRRLIVLALLLFLLAGLLIVEQRPHIDNEPSKLFSSLQDMMLPEMGHFLGSEPPKPVEKAKSAKEADLLHAELELEACTAFNPVKGFIDLRGLSNLGHDGKPQPWLAKDYESGRNFTLGICLSPVKKTATHNTAFKDVANVSEVGGYFIDPESQTHFLIGQHMSVPVFKGRKLTMTYENGSYCDAVMAADGSRVRRSTVLTFTCDREMLNKAHISHIATVQDCTYIFEVRSHYACPTAAKADNLAAIWIFLLILLAALMVFFSGSLMFKNFKTAAATH